MDISSERAGKRKEPSLACCPACADAASFRSYIRVRDVCVLSQPSAVAVTSFALSYTRGRRASMHMRASINISRSVGGLSESWRWRLLEKLFFFFRLFFRISKYIRIITKSLPFVYFNKAWFPCFYIVNFIKSSKMQRRFCGSVSKKALRQVNNTQTFRYVFGYQKMKMISSDILALFFKNSLR